jgi:hypothetical protein
MRAIKPFTPRRYLKYRKSGGSWPFCIGISRPAAPRK